MHALGDLLDDFGHLFSTEWPFLCSLCALLFSACGLMCSSLVVRRGSLKDPTTRRPSLPARSLA